MSDTYNYGGDYAGLYGGFGTDPQPLYDYFKNKITGIADTLAGNAMVPGQAYQSTPENPVTTEQMVKPAADLAGMMAGISTPFAQPGAAGVFGGRLSKTADIGAMNKAIDMEGAGKNVTDIFRNTGWFRGADQGWRYEIPDYRSKYVSPTEKSPLQLAQGYIDLAYPGQKLPLFGKGQNPTITKQALQYGENAVPRMPHLNAILKHPELYEAYPELRDIVGMNIRGVRGLNYEAGYRQGTLLDPTATIDFGGLKGRGDNRKNILHEVQHAIQQLENFSPGGNVTRKIEPGTPAEKIYQETLAEMLKPISQEQFIKE